MLFNIENPLLSFLLFFFWTSSEHRPPSSEKSLKFLKINLDNERKNGFVVKGMKATQSKIKVIAANIQKVKPFSPTDTSADKKPSIAIGWHAGKVNSFKYKAKLLPYDT